MSVLDKLKKMVKEAQADIDKSQAESANREPEKQTSSEDKVEKTPEWAAKICGISAQRIRELARLMAANRTQLVFGWSIQRQQHETATPANAAASVSSPRPTPMSIQDYLKNQQRK